jgi:hypothetical protein
MPYIHPRSDSQAQQESFVLNVLQDKFNGTFLEIGGYDPYSLSNTHVLESEFKWRGFAIEIDKKCARRYNKHRTNHCYQANAITFDYKAAIASNNLPVVIDYLQVDIEPALQSFQALTKVLFAGSIFRVITFEHDAYDSKENEHVRELSRAMLSFFGYRLIASNVKSKGFPFEDWWVHPDFVDESNYKCFLSTDKESTDLFDHTD